MPRILIANGPMQTTSSFPKVATGTSLKTLLQIEPSATLPMKIVEWGISFDGSSAATPGTVELIETDVAATVTASAAADLFKFDGDAIAAGTLTTNLVQVGTANTGYTASAEGSITTVRSFDLQLIAPTGQYVKQFPLGERPMLQVSKFTRIRTNFGTSVNAICYVLLEF